MKLNCKICWKLIVATSTTKQWHDSVTCKIENKIIKIHYVFVYMNILEHYDHYLLLIITIWTNLLCGSFFIVWSRSLSSLVFPPARAADMSCPYLSSEELTWMNNLVTLKIAWFTSTRDSIEKDHIIDWNMYA